MGENMLITLIFIPFITIGIILLVIIGMRSETVQQGRGDSLMKHIYTYLVLFATLMMTIGGSISIFMAVADIVSPAPYYQSYEEYKYLGVEDEDREKRTEKELRESYEKIVLSEYEFARKSAINLLIKSFGWIVIPLPIFIYFQRKLVKRT